MIALQMEHTKEGLEVADIQYPTISTSRSTSMRGMTTSKGAEQEVADLEVLEGTGK